MYLDGWSCAIACGCDWAEPSRSDTFVCNRSVVLACACLVLLLCRPLRVFFWVLRPDYSSLRPCCVLSPLSPKDSFEQWNFYKKLKIHSCYVTFSPWEACAPRTTHCFFFRRMNRLPRCHPLFASDERIRLLWMSSSDDLYEISSFSWWDLSLVQNSIVLPRFWAWPQVHSMKTTVRYNTTQHPVFCFFFPSMTRKKKKLCVFSGL